VTFHYQSLFISIRLDDRVKLFFGAFFDSQRGLRSQAARQGLAVLMASAVVVLKHETSTLRQRHNFISIDLTFGVGDYVREVTSPDKVGSGP